MAQFKVKGPDGKTYTVRGDNAEGAAKAVHQMIAEQGRGSIVDPFMQGVVPFADEAAGVVGGVMNMLPDSLGGGKFGDGGFHAGFTGVRDEANKNYEAFEARNPKTSMAAEMIGSIPTAIIPGVGAMKGASVASKVARGIGSGALYGGVYGAGKGDNNAEGMDLMGRGWDAANDAVIAGGLGGGIPLVGKAVGATVDRASRFNRGKPTGLPKVRPAGGDLILDDLANEGRTIAGVGREARSLGPQATISDVSENLGGRTAQLANSDNPMRGRVRNFFKGREAGAKGRLNDVYDGALGNKPDVYLHLEGLKRMRGDTGRSLYELSDPVPIRMTKKLAAILNSPSGGEALKKAAKNAADERTGIKFKMGPQAETRHWDQVKRALDDMIDSSYEADSFGAKKATNKTGLLTDMKNDLLHEVDLQNENWAKARKAWTSDTAHLKAFDKGMNIFSTKEHPDFWAAQLKEMADADKEALILGVRAAVDKAKGVVKNGALKSRQLLDSDWNAEKITATLGDEEGKKLISKLRAEDAMASTKNKALGPSQTSDLLDNPFRSRGLGEATEQMNELKMMATGHPLKGVQKFLDRVLSALDNDKLISLADSVGPPMIATGRQRDLWVRALRDYDIGRRAGMKKSEAIQKLVQRFGGIAGRAATNSNPLELTITNPLGSPEGSQ